MATHRQIEAWWSDRKCSGPHIKLTLNGRYPVRVQPELEDATVALEAAIMDNGYRTPMGPTGSYNCRTIGGSTTMSLHSYAVAIDWDYGKNPYLRGTRIQRGFKSDYRFELTERQVNAVEAIINDDGDSIWRWLGWTIGDTMHFQVDVPPDKCRVAGTAPPPILPPEEEEDMLVIGDTGKNVEKWQDYLNRWNDEHNIGQTPLVTDGEFGPSTETRTIEFQDWANIEQTGTVGSMDTGTMAIAVKIKTGS